MKVAPLGNRETGKPNAPRSAFGPLIGRKPAWLLGFPVYQVYQASQVYRFPGGAHCER